MNETLPHFDGVEAILFDLDGTLVETDNRWARILAERLRPMQRFLPRLNVEALARRIVMAIETPSNYAISTLEHLGLGHLFLGLADRIRRSKGLATREASEPVEGSEELIQALKGRYKLAVVTTRARPEALALLGHLGLSAHFEALVTRQDVWRMKPHPEPVYKAARLLGVLPSRCLMVGDTRMDIRSARRAGAYAVGVLSGFGERGELERAGAHLILDRAASLLGYLSR
ncbi:MAG: HAD family hydrolase [Chloroflexi bacterium]|nr:HAD family hydrolase [Chloroflexota bacterium]MBC7316257.1 HAD family hydrolase [Chloroflexota bacterium]